MNQVVYDLMTIAAQDMLDTYGTATYGGDFTAAEMAGTVGYLHQFIEGDDYKLIRIETETFCCSYHAAHAFSQMAEWEGVMNLSPKNCYRFACESKQESFNREPVKAYQRCHGYRPRTISLAAENARIAKKFEVLGAMARSLTSEGMRRALSVLTAIESIKKMHGYDMADLAGRLLRRKLWRDYGRDQYQQPVCYTASDFKDGPEVWKQVDDEYVRQQVDYFRQVLADSPAPTWLKANDMVQLKDQEKQCKKWQGKLSVWRVESQLDYYKDAIGWYAVVCTTKGKHDSMTSSVDYLEPWVEPSKPKKKPAKKAKPKQAEKVASKREKSDACIDSSEREQARPKVKASFTNNRETIHEQPENCSAVADSAIGISQPENRHKPTAEPTLADRLREALLRQMRQAA